jgi:hypothetical protein
MQHLHTDQTAYDRLRLVFNDRVIFLPLSEHATMEDIAQAVRGVGVRHHGDPVAIDVTVGMSRNTPFIYEDDAAAEFAYVLSPDAIAIAPDHMSGLAKA